MKTGDSAFSVMQRLFEPSRLAGIRSFYQRRNTALLFALLLFAVCAIKLSYVEFWLTDNDNYATLGTFFRPADHPNYLRSARALYEVAVKSCAPEDKRCFAYAGAIFGDQAYARPIIAWAGSLLVDAGTLANGDALLRGIQAVTGYQVIVSTVLLGLLLPVFVLTLPRSMRGFLLGMSAFFGVASLGLAEHAAFWRFQPLLGVGLGSAVVVLIAALAAWGFRRHAAGALPGLLQQIDPQIWTKALWSAALGLLALRIVGARFPTFYAGLAVPAAGAGLFMLLLLIAGVAVFVVAVTVAVARQKKDDGLIWAALFLLFGFVSIGESFFTTAFHIAPRGSIYLLAAPIMLYIALRPNGWAIWVLPVLVLFHVPIAGLLGGCIAAVELVVSVRRRRISLSFFLGAAIFVLATLYTMRVGGNAVVPTGSEATGLILRRLSVLTAVPGIVVFLILAYAGLVAWRMPDPAGDFLLRAVVLAGMLAGAGQIREILERAGYDLMDPVAYNYILMWYYLSPIVCGAGTFLVLFAISNRGPGRTPGEFRLSRTTLSIATAGVVALMAVRSESSISRPANIFVAAIRGGLLVTNAIAPRNIDLPVREAAAADDHYVVGPHPGDATTMTSILKMKLRAATGRLDPDRATFSSLKRVSN